MQMSALLEKMAIFVALMVIGYVCGRTKYVSPSFAKDSSKLVINVFMFATIINSVISSDLSIAGDGFAMAILVMSAAIVINYVVAAVACRVIPMDDGQRPQFELLIAVVNNMFIALPILAVLYGNLAVFYCALANISYNIILYSYGIYRLQSTGGRARVRLRDMLSMPLIATVIALFLFLLRPPIPGVVKQLMSTMSGATMPLSMLVIGASLGSVSLLDSFRNWRLYVMSALRLAVCPLLVWLVLRLVTDDPVLLNTAVIVSASPSGIIVTALSIQYGKDAVFTSEGILLGTVLSMLTIPAVAFLLG